MTEPDFIHTELSRVGAFLHAWLGPSTTVRVDGPARSRVLSIRSEDNRHTPCGTITCQQVVYVTRYRRWWVPQTKRTVYVVSASVPPAIKLKFGADFFTSASYPLLCNRLLQWTTYPHLCAIHAYLDALLEKLRRTTLQPQG